MRLWRIARRRFADLTGEGARDLGGRWNSPGRAVLYLAEHPALAALEVRVHLDLPPALLPKDYVLLAVDLDDRLPIETVATVADWEQTRAIGDGWLEGSGLGRRAPLLRVPSILVPRAWNVLVDPRPEPVRRGLTLAETLPFAFDSRLWWRP